MSYQGHSKNIISRTSLRISETRSRHISIANLAISFLLVLSLAVNIVEMFIEKVPIFGLTIAYALENDYSIIRNYYKEHSMVKVEAECFEFETRYFPFIPYSLHGSLKSSAEAAKYFYWVRVMGKNLCSDDVEIEIKFKHLRDIPIIENEYRVYNPHKYTLSPNEKAFDKRVSPGFKFNTVNDYDGDLRVQWAVYHKQKGVTSKRTKIKTFEENIKILSKYNFCWNLPTPEGGRVSKDFLLAALTAWTISNNDAVTRRADLILKSVNFRQAPEMFATKFVGEFYEKNFFGEAPEISVIPTPVRFPPDDHLPPNQKWSGTRLRIPVQILSSKWAKPIEAALLLRALTSSKKGLFDERDVDFVLIAYPDESGETGILLSWHVGFRWTNAVDMRRTDLPFEKNLEIARSKLKAILDNNTDIVRALKQKGVYYSTATSIAAIDFSSAKKKFGIQSLP